MIKSDATFGPILAERTTKHLKARFLTASSGPPAHAGRGAEMQSLFRVHDTHRNHQDKFKALTTPEKRTVRKNDWQTLRRCANYSDPRRIDFLRERTEPDRMYGACFVVMAVPV